MHLLSQAASICLSSYNEKIQQNSCYSNKPRIYLETQVIVSDVHKKTQAILIEYLCETLKIHTRF